MGLSGQKSSLVLQGCVVFWSQSGGSVACYSLLLESAHIFWFLQPHSSIFQDNKRGSGPSQSHLSCSFPPLPSQLKSSCDLRSTDQPPYSICILNSIWPCDILSGLQGSDRGHLWGLFRKIHLPQCDLVFYFILSFVLFPSFPLNYKLLEARPLHYLYLSGNTL